MDVFLSSSSSFFKSPRWGYYNIESKRHGSISLESLPPPSPDAPCRLGLYHFRFVSCMCPVWDVVITIFGRSFRVRVLVCLAVGPATIPRDLLGAEQ
jgi:hypothetical protein